MIKPVGKHIVIRREPMTISPDVILAKGTTLVADGDDLKSGSIIIPGSAKAKAIWGTVVAIGKRCRREGREIKVGDRVVIPWTWKPPKKDPDLGEVEVLEEVEIMAVER